MPPFPWSRLLGLGDFIAEIPDEIGGKRFGLEIHGALCLDPSLGKSFLAV
jgi:hypothetical protein